MQFIVLVELTGETVKAHNGSFIEPKVYGDFLGFVLAWPFAVGTYACGFGVCPSPPLPPHLASNWRSAEGVIMKFRWRNDWITHNNLPKKCFSINQQWSVLRQEFHLQASTTFRSNGYGMRCRNRKLVLILLAHYLRRGWNDFLVVAFRCCIWRRIKQFLKFGYRIRTWSY